MFIELTDHLRCPSDHDEAYLVLLPDMVERRDVRSGRLGCPVCGWEASIVDGIADFGGGRPATLPTALSGDAIRTFLGLAGPGGHVALVAGPARLAPELAPVMPGVAFVLVNPPAETKAELPASVVRGGRLSLKAGSMRGIVVGRDAASDPIWVRDAANALLTGLRMVVEGSPLDLPGVDVLAEADGIWVGRKQ